MSNSALCKIGLMHLFLDMLRFAFSLAVWNEVRQLQLLSHCLSNFLVATVSVFGVHMRFTIRGCMCNTDFNVAVEFCWSQMIFDFLSCHDVTVADAICHLKI